MFLFAHSTLVSAISEFPDRRPFRSFDLAQGTMLVSISRDRHFSSSHGSGWLIELNAGPISESIRVTPRLVGGFVLIDL